MTTQAETRQLPVDIGLPEGVFKGFQKAKNFWGQTVDTLTESAKLARESLKQTTGQAVNTLTKATDKAVDTVTATTEQAKDSLTTKTHAAVDTVTTVTSDSVKTITATAKQAQASLEETIEQTKGSLEQTLQTAEQFKSTTSEAMKMAISSSISDWLQAHPVAFRLVQMLIWATNHPIVSLIIFLFAVAIAWSLIKALGRLIETIGSYLLQAPFKLSQVLIKIGFKSLGKFKGLAVNQLVVAKNTKTPALPDSDSQLIQQDKQQRAAEILTRLEAMRQEQNELLQEVAAILASNKLG